MNTVFFSGYGFAPIFFLILSGFAGLIFGFDINNETTMARLMFINAALTGLVVLWLQIEKKRNPESKRIPKENTLMFIPINCWPFILLAIGISKLS